MLPRVSQRPDLLHYGQAENIAMTYSKRIQIAALLSLFLHFLGLALWHYLPSPVPPVTPVALEPAPIELDLQPDAPAKNEPVQLVDVNVPAPTPVPPSPLIAETSSEAMDAQPRDGDRPSPELEPDDFDELAALPAPEVAPQPEPMPAQEERTEPPEESEEPVEEEDLNDYDAMESDLDALIAPKEGSAPEPAEEQDEIIQIARADAALPQRATTPRSRPANSYSKQGVTNFQAIESEIAPYLKHVRSLVELQWNEMLYTKYSGTKPTEAVIDCAISPTGELVSVSVVEANNDRVYSALCREAVQRAGPFGPFPFEVPDIYRDKNLEIRWTFSYFKRR